MAVEFIPLSATREKSPHLPSGYAFVYVEAALDTEAGTVTFLRTSSTTTHMFILSLEDLDEFFAAYDALVTGAPSESASEINERGVAQLQRSRPTR